MSSVELSVFHLNLASGKTYWLHTNQMCPILTKMCVVLKLFLDGPRDPNQCLTVVFEIRQDCDRSVFTFSFHPEILTNESCAAGRDSRGQRVHALGHDGRRVHDAR